VAPPRFSPCATHGWSCPPLRHGEHAAKRGFNHTTNLYFRSASTSPASRSGIDQHANYLIISTIEPVWHNPQRWQVKCGSPGMPG
jgi:hypothetical protein